MRILIVHREPQYFAGAEKVLIYFLNGAREAGWDLTVAAAPGSKFWGQIPERIQRVAVEDDRKFSIRKLLRQVRILKRAHRQNPFDAVHAWAARDWELAALAGFHLSVPAFGTLHDHPRARFLSKSRQRLMKLAFWWNLQKVACVSEAVRQACLAAGYRAAKLAVIHNGLGPRAPRPRILPSDGGVRRLGFLGAFSERKGLRGLFEIIREFSKLAATGWELEIAGEPQDAEGKALVESIRARHSQCEWWRQVHWTGWASDSSKFLESLDLLIFPSNEFDPLPTVLLEAGRCGIPVLAARVGGVEEIVQHDRTGWLFGAGAWNSAAEMLAGLLGDSEKLRQAGAAAAEWTATEFSLAKMIARYRDFYSTL